VIMLVIQVLSFGADSAASEAPPIKLVHADSSGFNFDELGSVYKFWGNVHFIRDSADLRADHAIHWENQNIVFLSGNVSVDERYRFLSADSLRYHQKSAITNAWGNVAIVDYNRHVRLDGGHCRFYESDEVLLMSDSSRLLLDFDLVPKPTTIQADTIKFMVREDIVEAWGNVVITDYSRHVLIRGEWARFYKNDESLLMTGSPQMILDFDLAVTPTVIEADTIRFLAEEDIVLAVDSVRISQGSLNARADDGVFYIAKEEFCLTGNVDAYQRNNTLSGDEMVVYSENKVLQRIEVEGTGESVFKQPAKADTLVYNQSRLTADKIDFFFSSDIISQIKACGNSYTNYTPAREDTVATGSNKASADSTTIYFSQGRMDEMVLVTSAEGSYVTIKEYDSLGAISRADTVKYRADRINFQLNKDMILLHQAAKVHQENVVLEAHLIEYDTDRKIVHAFGHFDSTEMKYIPVNLREGSEDITGEQLAYDLASKRGKIKKSKTKLEQAYYGGSVLRREQKDQILVQNGTYTTCEYNEPHFHFYSPNMKLISGNKVFARPIILYIETVPVLILPYFVFSIEKGRHSGFLPFQFGNFEQGQRSVNNLGYYWALSEYWDLKTWFDIYESTGPKINATARYAIRYKLRGSISGSYSRETQHIDYTRVHPVRWRVSFTHDQTIDPSLSIKGSGNFISDASYYSDFSTDPAERLNRQLRSNMSITKRWEGATFSAAVDQTKDLDRNEHTEKLPILRFSKPSKPFFSLPKNSADKRWYHDLYYSYSADMLNFSNKSIVNEEVTRKKYTVFDQTVALRAPQKLFSAITISPSFTLYDNWYYLPYSDKAVEQELETNSLKNRQNWRSAISLSTNLYGTVEPNLLGITGFRHVFSPSASFSYRPEFTRNTEYASFTGVGGSGSEQKSISFSIKNQFQAKYRKGEREIKQTLFNFNVNSSYNFTKDTQRWSDISSSLRAPTIKNLSLQLTMRHDPYDEETGELCWWKPRLENLSISSSYRGTIMIPGRDIETVSQPGLPRSGRRDDTRNISFGIAHGYGESRLASKTNISHWIKFDLQMSPSKNWRVKYHQYYDFRTHETTSKEIEIYRDLHCWEGVFTWIPDGSRKGYYFKINVKLLPELKFEKSESGIRGLLESGIRDITSY